MISVFNSIFTLAWCMFNRSGAPFLTSTKGVTSMARPYLYYSCAEFTMTYSASAVFLIFIILFAFASAALLDALRYEHCESTSSFLLLYLPLFLVNNVFVTLVVFIYWIASEKKHPTAVNHRFARRFIYEHNCLLFSYSISYKIKLSYHYSTFCNIL
ncbi:hypothetical protein DICVIV_06821 [Dictyocaulus viviparus]|uniref:Uncharacterized protein n=1 Tax=Dictyocaulus viviparus TaxID=29172 RepID=A0A0D8XR03_DICVI|nr:hypothetical protein DICVIV_06821 [Dictyocaulus viviparus]